jgi:hypothetical protein
VATDGSILAELENSASSDDAPPDLIPFQPDQQRMIGGRQLLRRRLDQQEITTKWESGLHSNAAMHRLRPVVASP